MAPELFPSVPGAASGMATRKEAEDRVTEKVRHHCHSWQPYPVVCIALLPELRNKQLKRPRHCVGHLDWHLESVAVFPCELCGRLQCDLVTLDCHCYSTP